MRRRGAFTLIEMLVSLSVLVVVLGLMGMMFAEIMRLRGAQDNYARRRDAALHVLRDVARAVSESQGFLTEAGGVSSDGNALLLRTEKGTLIYRSEPGRVRRVRIGPSGEQEETLMSAEGVEIRFNLEGSSPGVARSAVATAEWTEPAQVGISRPTLSLRATRRAQP